MSVSVQFAADMETCRGCNEEEAFTLLRLVFECQRWHSSISISAGSYIIGQAAFIIRKILRKNGYTGL